MPRVVITLACLWAIAANAQGTLIYPGRTPAGLAGGSSGVERTGAAAIGDSLTAGVPLVDRPWPEGLNGRTPYTWRNLGVHGDTTGGMMLRYQRYIQGQRDAIVVIWGGANDLNAAISAATICSNLTTMAGWALAAGSRVVLLELSPRGNGSGYGPTTQASIEDSNACLAEWVAEHPGAILVHTYSLLGDPQVPTQLAEECNGDGGDWLHPTQECVDRIRNAVDAVL